MDLARAWRASAPNAALVGIVCIAFALRLPGYLLAPPLWLDEAWRAERILDPAIVSGYLYRPSLYTGATAPLFVLIVKAFAFASVSELSLRAVSLASGILAVALAWMVVRRATGKPTMAALAAAMVAANYSFVRYSSEFKPYAFEVAVHLGLTYFWIAFLAAAPTQRRKAFVLAIAAAVVGLLAGANTVFVIPALSLSLAYGWLKDRGNLSGSALIGGFAAVGLAMAAMYFLVWRYGRDPGLIQFWAKGFNTDGQPYAAFLAQKADEMFGAGAFAFVHHDYHGSLRLVPIAQLALALGCAVGLISSLRRLRFELLLFYGTLALTAVALNFLGFWPLGAYAQNQFLYAHMIVGGVLLLGEIRWSVLRNAVAASCVVALSSGLLRLDLHKLQLDGAPPIEQSRDALEVLAGEIAREGAATCEAPRSQVFLNPGINPPFLFYTKYHDARSGLRALVSGCNEIVVVPEAYSDAGAARRRISESLRAGINPWFAYSHLSAVEAADLIQVARSFGEVTGERSFTGAGVFRLVVSPDFRQTK